MKCQLFFLILNINFENCHSCISLDHIGIAGNTIAAIGTSSFQTAAVAQNLDKNPRIVTVDNHIIHHIAVGLANSTHATHVANTANTPSTATHNLRTWVYVLKHCTLNWILELKHSFQLVAQILWHERPSVAFFCIKIVKVFYHFYAKHPFTVFEVFYAILS